MHAIKWTAALGEMSRENLTPMPALRNVRLEYPDKCLSVIDDVAEFERDASAGGLEAAHSTTHKCPLATGGSDIFGRNITPDHIVLDKVRYESRSMWSNGSDHTEIWRCRDGTIKNMLHDMRYQVSDQRLLSPVRTTMTSKNNLPSTLKDCANMGIDLYTAVERDAQKRIRDFLLLGEVQQYVFCLLSCLCESNAQSFSPGGIRSLTDDVPRR